MEWMSNLKENFESTHLSPTKNTSIDLTKSKNKVPINYKGEQRALELVNDNVSCKSNESSSDKILANSTPKKKRKIKVENEFTKSLYKNDSYELDESQKSENSFLRRKKKNELKTLVDENFYIEDKLQMEEIKNEGIMKIEKLAEKVKAKIEKSRDKKKNGNSLPQKFKIISTKTDKKLSETRDLIESNFSNQEYKFDLLIDDEKIKEIAEKIKNKIFIIKKDYKPKKRIRKIKAGQKSRYRKKEGIKYGRLRYIKEYRKTIEKRDKSKVNKSDLAGYCKVAFHMLGKSISKISKNINKNFSHVSYFLKSKNKRKNREKIIDNDAKLFLKKTCIDQKYHVSTSKAKKLLADYMNIDVCKETVRKTLCELGKIYRRREIPKKPDDYEKRRVEFIKYLEEKNIKGKEIMFTDEKWFTFEIDSHKISRISPETREKQKLYDKEANKLSERPTEKFPRKFMVAGGISWNGLSDLIFISGKVDGFSYVQALNYYERSMKRLGFNGYFQQDGASVHDAKDSSSTFLKNFKLLENWPPSSPDLSPIEIVWAFLESARSNYKVDNVQQLKLLIAYLWYKIPVEYCQSLISNFDERIKWVKKNNGALYKEFTKKKETKFGFNVLKSLQPWKSYINPFSIIAFSLEASLKIRDDELKALISSVNTYVKKNQPKTVKLKDKFRYSTEENTNKKMFLDIAKIANDTSFQEILRKRLSDIECQNSILDYILQRKFNLEDCLRMIGQNPLRPINIYKFNDPKDEDFDLSTMATETKYKRFDLNDYFDPGDLITKNKYSNMLISIEKEEQIFEKFKIKTEEDIAKYNFMIVDEFDEI